jgi:hypothetical protein
MRADSKGNFKGTMRFDGKPGKHKIFAVATDKDSNIIQESNTVEIFVRKPSGSCPRCFAPVYPTGKTSRTPAKLKAGLSIRDTGISKEWTYERQNQCTKCRRKFPDSLVLPYEE